MRYSLLLLFTFIVIQLSAQDVALLHDSILPNTKKVDQNPVTLVNKLIEGKTTELEKFNVIFTWVVKNIEYDYTLAESPNGSTILSVNTILKRKKGICIDYAFLMDTLCSLAGITNVSVYGYAKDELFDVYDPLYIDNHAWNAVRIDDQWYVYDATWSVGQYSIKYRKISQFFLNWIDKVRFKTKLKKIRFVLRKSECNKKKIKYKRTFRTHSLGNRILYRLLMLKKIRAKRVFAINRTYDFYLTQPEVFAITHFPNNPYWSLIKNYSIVRDFEADSSYYHLSKFNYQTQVRTGRYCDKCDNYLSLDSLARFQELKKNSAAFNSKNKSISWLCNYEIGNIYFKQSLLESDSATRIHLIDTTLFYFSNAKSDLNQCMKNVGKESYFQKNKNKKKLTILTEENKAHTKTNTLILNASANRVRKIKSIRNSNKVLQSKLRVKKVNIIHAGKKHIIISNKPKAGDKVAVIQAKLERSCEKTDSLNQLIHTTTNDYDQKLNIATNQIWRHLNDTSSLGYYFYTGGKARYRRLLDNYKKPIVELRRELNKYEKIHTSKIQDSIIVLSDSCVLLYKKYTKTLKKRNDQLFKSVKLLSELVKENVITKDSLFNFSRTTSSIIQEDICWIIKNEPIYNAYIFGLNFLIRNEKDVLLCIKYENGCERSRFKIISKIVTDRKIRLMTIPKHNFKFLIRERSKVRKSKSEFLANLRAERKNK